ncbi:hypothetical protein F511_05863 [Dorcoceras hygrometricum]|uniref:Uncharacterized protein n=1 Tax=Dorcoceras hygrometricum TaxID=472368 RepID=A0A2Z7CZU2_9LAMI|nr:hypothetical protein F511_05863 [Dorcoceras hygrometricum]
MGTKKASENAAKEEQSAIVENTDVQEEADDTGTSINQRKTLNLGVRVAYTQGLLCPSLLMIIPGTYHLYSGREPAISTLVGNLSSPLWSGTCYLYSDREPVISATWPSCITHD